MNGIDDCGSEGPRSGTRSSGCSQMSCPPPLVIGEVVRLLGCNTNPPPEGGNTDSDVTGGMSQEEAAVVSEAARGLQTDDRDSDGVQTMDSV